MTPSILLETKEVSKAFGGLLALNKVDITLHKGEVWALIGPNGAGKTTLFNIITGHLKADEGSVIFKGLDITGFPPKRIWEMGISRTFQIPAVFISKTVSENVQLAFFSKNKKTLQFLKPYRKMFMEQVYCILEEVGLIENSQKISAFLSYGDLKKLELAIALANDPELLLLDEPTAGMAPSERGELMELVGTLSKERGITVLFTEHDMDVVFSCAEKIAVLHQGEIIAVGHQEEIKGNPGVEEIYLGTSN
jgi:branched-chain amino acid transport system ATP-binding protein